MAWGSTYMYRKKRTETVHNWGLPNSTKFNTQSFCINAFHLPGIKGYQLTFLTLGT